MSAEIKPVPGMVPDELGVLEALRKIALNLYPGQAVDLYISLAKMAFNTMNYGNTYGDLQVYPDTIILKYRQDMSSGRLY